MFKIVNIEHDSPRAEKSYKQKAGAYGKESHPLRRIVDEEGNIVGKMRKQRRQATRPDGTVDYRSDYKWVWIIDFTYRTKATGVRKLHMNVFPWERRPGGGRTAYRDAWQKEVKGLREAKGILAGLSRADHVPNLFERKETK
jgi:hypothetical protein